MSWTQRPPSGVRTPLFVPDVTLVAGPVAVFVAVFHFARIQLYKIKNPQSVGITGFCCGAAGQIRTADLVITN